MRTGLSSMLAKSSVRGGRWASALALAVVCGGVACGQGTALAPSRGQSWHLGESILRETYATLDRGLDFLAARQGADGLWALADGFRTCAPALAFAGETPVSAPLLRAAESVAEGMDRSVSGLLPSRELVELARGVLVLRASGIRGDLVPRAVRRLELAGLGRLGAEEAALVLDVLGLEGRTPGETAWGTVVARTLAVRNPVPATVALAGFARLERGNLPVTGNAVRAHLRWLAGKELKTADDAWWLVRFLDRLPPVALHEAGFPLDWRRHVADALIARQRRDPATGFGYWAPPKGSKDAGVSGDAVLNETARAASALRWVAD